MKTSKASVKFYYYNKYMKKTLTILFALLLCAPAMAQKGDKKSDTPMFGVSQQGKDYFLDIPESLVGRRFLATVRLTSSPANTGQYGGEQVNQQTVYFEKVQDKLLLRSELMLNVSDTLSAINRAVIISNANPIIGAFKVEKSTGGRLRIKVTDFFNEDNAALGLAQWHKQRFGLAGLLPALSYIESIKSFPMNTEVRTVKTWSSSQPATFAGRATGKVTVGLNVSFVLLPEKPMTRRFFDPRVGYFTDSFVYYSDYQQRVEPKRFITRWRLEPKDSADAERMKRGELVEPKKQIVYYIDPATPKQWRPYLMQGVEDWQPAFEQAGFKNAIVAKEWPDSDKTMSMEDARFSVIRYLASPIENAYGPQVHDPRSGEILESHICWYHNVMTLVHDWYMIQAGTLDEAARQMKYDTELMGQLIRFVSSHEVGHTLGLRHNFGSSSTVPVDSLRDKEWVETHGHTPSIMDYARFNYVAQPEDSIGHDGIFPRIGDYDKWAIKWGYTPMPQAYDDESDRYFLQALFTPEVKANRRLWFGDGETNQTRDARCQTEDLGDDAVKASALGILNLKREVKALPDWTYQRNDFYAANLSNMYRQVRTQFLRYMGHVIGNIGGVYKDWRTQDDGGILYRNVPKARQRECLRFVAEQALEEPSWLIAEDYAMSLAPDVRTLLVPVAQNVVGQLSSIGLLGEMNAEWPAEEYLSELCALVFRELPGGGAVGDYRRTVQETFMLNLTKGFAVAGLGSRARPAVLQLLRELLPRLEGATAADAATRAHYASLADCIRRALEVK